jgi:hypothetical protein
MTRFRLEKELPMSGDKFDREVDKLIAGGIFAALPDYALDLAENAYNFLWKKIKVSLHCETDILVSESDVRDSRWNTASNGMSSVNNSLRKLYSRLEQEFINLKFLLGRK